MLSEWNNTGYNNDESVHPSSHSAQFDTISPVLLISCDWLWSDIRGDTFTVPIKQFITISSQQTAPTRFCLHLEQIVTRWTFRVFKCIFLSHDLSVLNLMYWSVINQINTAALLEADVSKHLSRWNRRTGVRCFLVNGLITVRWTCQSFTLKYEMLTSSAPASAFPQVNLLLMTCDSLAEYKTIAVKTTCVWHLDLHLKQLTF